MIRGLVIGKFMPIHKGHIALIEFAAGQCDELIVSMSFTPVDPIDPELRFSWICEIFKASPNIKPAISPDDFDNEMLPMEERTRIWAQFIQKRFPPVDLLFSSEEYGGYFANHLSVPHYEFNRQRSVVPVSATMIREHPFENWEFIPDVVRPYFVKKICFYGAESTGKSTLAIFFAKKYNTGFVPEVAREMLESNDFTINDIIKIGHSQTERVFQKLEHANKFLFCDTDLITTEIYSRHYLNEVPEVLYALEAKIKYDVYFLMEVDVPWVADGLRDLGERRSEMAAVFRNELEKRGIEYIVVKGSFDERIAIVEMKLNEFS